MAVLQGNFPGNNRLTTEPPNGGDGMDTRLTKLETRLDTVLPTLATKTDIAETKAAIAGNATAIATAESGVVKWLSGIVIAVVSLAVAVMLFAINRISPPQSQQAAPPVIVYPMQQPVAPAASPKPTR